MISDTIKGMERLAADPTGITDPFQSMYELVYQLTMRTVACNEIAEDPAMLKKTLRLYEEVEKAATPTVVMYPWLPSPAKLKRMWGGAQLYMIFKNIVDVRNKTSRREDDALQFLMDQGDDIRSIIGVRQSLEQKTLRNLLTLISVCPRRPLCRPAQLRNQCRLDPHLPLPIP